MSGSVNIIRSRPRVEFTALPNAIANDQNLSARALGVIYYILSKPPDWRVIPNQLGKRFNLSYRVVLKIMGELIDAGYVKRELVRNGRWITGTRYLVADERWGFPDSDEEQEKVDMADASDALDTECETSKNGAKRPVPILQHAESRQPYKELKDNKSLQPKALPPAARGSTNGLAREPTSNRSRPSAQKLSNGIWRIPKGTTQFEAWRSYHVRHSDYRAEGECTYCHEGDSIERASQWPK